MRKSLLVSAPLWLLSVTLPAQAPTAIPPSSDSAALATQQQPATKNPYDDRENPNPAPVHAPGAAPVAKSDKDDDAPIAASKIHNPTLWHDPGAISSLDLYLGQGGEAGKPVPPFGFDAEDMNGTNPKFDAHDANGKKWRVKLGNEARPEVVASRLLWAMGYYVEDDYVLTSAHIDNLQMKRGGGTTKNGFVSEARFSRKPEGQKKIGIWEWKENPFKGTKEFNGLRVMMAVMNNWDLKDVNNAVFADKGSDQQIFIVSDVGATFGTNGLSWSTARSKGNVGSFKGSKFIEKTTDTGVSFSTPHRPSALLLVSGVKTKDYITRGGYEWIGDNVPRADAKWMGSMLGQLSHKQIVDAFRAGHFPPDQIDAFVDVVESRIRELQTL